MHWRYFTGYPVRCVYDLALRKSRLVAKIVTDQNTPAHQPLISSDMCVSQFLDMYVIPYACPPQRIINGGLYRQSVTFSQHYLNHDRSETPIGFMRLSGLTPQDRPL
jgi:hypothetical protein